MRDNWDNEIEAHFREDCPTCGGSGFYKTPFGCIGDGCEDEDNCYCDCHANVLKGDAP